MRRRSKILLVGCLLVIALVVFQCARFLGVGFDESKQPWVTCPIELPDGQGRMVFLRKHIHPFLAEYDRRIRFQVSGGQDTTAPLPLNVGGRTKINVYWYERQDEAGPFLRLQDHWGEYLVDPKRQVTRLLGRVDGRIFAGDLTDNNTLGIRVIGSEGETSVWVGDRQAEDITSILNALPSKYIGRLDGTTGDLGFISAESSAEEKIDIVQ